MSLIQYKQKYQWIRISDFFSKIQYMQKRNNNIQIQQNLNYQNTYPEINLKSPLIFLLHLESIVCMDWYRLWEEASVVGLYLHDRLESNYYSLAKPQHA